MKKFQILLIILNSSLLFSQHEKAPKKNKLNSFSIEFYQPIDNTFSDFYGFDYGVGNSVIGINNYERNQFTSSIGISYERVCSNNIIFRPRLGVSLIRNNEYELSEVSNGQTTKEYDYRQNHINFFVGLAKRVPIANRITLDLGVEFVSIYYLEGKGNFFRTFEISDQNSDDIFLAETNISSIMGKVFSFGIGPYIKPQLTVFENLFISFEMKMYFMRTFIDEPSFFTETYRYTLNGNELEFIESETIVNNNLKFWSWSNVIPLFSVGYKF